MITFKSTESSLKSFELPVSCHDLISPPLHFYRGTGGKLKIMSLLRAASKEELLSQFRVGFLQTLSVHFHANCPEKNIFPALNGRVSGQRTSAKVDLDLHQPQPHQTSPRFGKISRETLTEISFVRHEIESVTKPCTQTG